MDDMRDWLEELAEEADKRGFLGAFVIVRKDDGGGGADDMAMISTHEPAIMASMLAEAFRHAMESVHREGAKSLTTMLDVLPHMKFILEQLLAAGFRYDEKAMQRAMNAAMAPSLAPPERTTVTIEISEDDAKYMAFRAHHYPKGALQTIAFACRDALDAKG